MKKSAMALFAVGILFSGCACEMDEGDPPDSGLQEVIGPDVTQDILYALEHCAAPNVVFADRCCSLEGTWGGMCKYNRDWIASGGCGEEFVKDGMQYCCGGILLSEMGAYGYQCVEE